MNMLKFKNHMVNIKHTLKGNDITNYITNCINAKHSCQEISLSIQIEMPSLFWLKFSFTESSADIYIFLTSLIGPAEI